MKTPGLLLALATLSAFAPSTAATVKVQHPGEQPALMRCPWPRCPCPGCFTVIHAVPVEKEPGRPFTVLSKPQDGRIPAEELPRGWLQPQDPEVSPPGRGSRLEGEPTKGDLVTLQLFSTTHPLRRQRNRTKSYRTGSLSALSRTAIADAGTLPGEKDGNSSRPEREAASLWDPCLGCCAAQWPDPPGSREIQPTAAPPRGNGTRGELRPGAYTPMRKVHKAGSYSGTLWDRPREARPTPDRCHGCCRLNATAGARPPGSREAGKGAPRDPTLGDSPVKGAWRPVLGTKDPNQAPSPTGKLERPLALGGALRPWQNHAGR